jgi:hypothetical protein
MSLYPVHGHPLLSDAAKALNGQALDLTAQAAEDALGLNGTTYTGDAATRAAIAVARQVNRMLAEPIDPYLTSHSRGEESKSWGRAGEARTNALDPIAVAIVAALAAEAAGAGEETVGGYTILASLR